MKLWIRVDACTPRDPKVAELADRLGVSVPLAVGHLVMLWGVMAEHTPDGLVGSVGVRPLEQWAGWTGKRGRFYDAFCELFVTDGVVNGWAGRQGALIARMEKDRLRKIQGNSTEARRNSTPTERNGTEPTTTATTSAAKKPRAARVNPSWLDACAREWEAKFGAGTFPFGEAGAHLKALHKAGHLPAELADYLRRYLHRTDTQYVSLARFAKTYAEYKPHDANALVDEYGCLTPLGEKETRPLRIA
jgi:hypothetical protein